MYLLDDGTGVDVRAVRLYNRVFLWKNWDILKILDIFQS